MKKLILIRHAKSSWSDPATADIDRELNSRGERDAPEMAKRLKKKKIDPDLLVSSPAVRAHDTARHFAKVFDIPKSDIKIEPTLYLAEPPAFFAVLSRLDDEFDTVALFSHNGGITDFANRLTNTRVDDMPTCAMFAVAAEIDKWSDFQESTKSFLFFDYPKNQ
jgi:phosphohistidine phosphatase